MPEQDLEGVFVEGKPLAKFLEDAERDEKSRQIEEVRKEGEKRKSFTVVYGDEKRVKPDTRKVAKRVKRYTDREIRKEYGVMQKPFKTRAENAIWIIMEKGPLSAKEIGKEIGFEGSTSTMSAMVSTIWQRLGNIHPGALDILTRDSHAGSFLYSKKPGVDISAEQAIEKYHLAGTSKYRRKVALIMQTEKEKAEWQKLKAQQKKDPAEKITQDIAKTVQSFLGVKIKVSGRIDIVFRFER